LISIRRLDWSVPPSAILRRQTQRETSPRSWIGVRLSAREAPGPPRSQGASLASGDVLRSLTPTSLRTVHRPTSSPVVWASRGLPALPWSRPGASPGCRERTRSAPTLGSAVKTSSCDSPTRVMARPRPKGPGGNPAVSRQRRPAAGGRGPSPAAHGGRGGVCMGEYSGEVCPGQGRSAAVCTRRPAGCRHGPAASARRAEREPRHPVCSRRL
jgi:hypothetical protein